jgi:coenzyme F420 hydrogenase subunit beta
MLGFKIRQEMNDIVEAPGKRWFWELEAGVIDADRCVQCGTCVAACPSDSLGVGRSGLPALVKMCTGCGLCWDMCPRGGLRYEATWPGSAQALEGGPAWRITGAPEAEGLGVVREALAARVRRGGGRPQDGGVVSAVLAASLEEGAIDAVLLARPSESETWKGEPHLATSTQEVWECAGSFYNQTMALAHLDLKKAGLGPEARVAVVGTPCEVQGIRAMQARPWRTGSSRVDAVVLTIALLCTKSFDYQGLMLRELRDKRGVELADVGKVDVVHGRMVVEDRSGRTLVDEPVRDFHGAALKGCDECADFLGRAADISVGSVGSPPGWSSVLVRTEAGARALERARGQLELAELERPEALHKLDSLDRRVALESLKRKFDPDGPLFIDYDEHLGWYGGTDRAPVVRDR